MIFSRYVLTLYAKTFLMLLCSILLVFIVLDYVGMIEVWMTKPRVDAARYYALYAPQIVVLVLPVVVLLTSVIAIGNLARHLELAAMKAAGRPLIRMLAPVFVFVCLICAGAFLLADQVIPDANHARLQIAQPKTKKIVKPVSMERYQFVFVGLGQAQYLFQYYNAKQKKGTGVTLFELHGGRIHKRWDADSLKWVQGAWLAYGVVERQFADAGVQWERRETWALPKSVFPEKPSDLIDERHKPDEMSLKRMERKMELLKHAGESTRELETQWHFRFATAAVPLVVALLGIALSHRVLRGGLAKGILWGLFFAFMYYIVLRMGLILGSNGAAPPWLGAWFGNLIFGAMSLIAFWRSTRL